MAAGAPFVTSDFENIRDACDSEGGLFVRPDDVDEIAGAIERVLTDDALADRLQAAGLTAVRDRYNFETEGARLVASLREALGE
jgi:glycosyltransferase involved in cell wall biosynthesis